MVIRGTGCRRIRPKVIVSPFLTARFPESIWREKTCLIVQTSIAGDRGPNSVDWAIKTKRIFWGVTVLQAAKEMDAKDIWSTSEFSVRENITKTSMYIREVSGATCSSVLRAMSRFRAKIGLEPFDYFNNEVKGQLNPAMKGKDTTVDLNHPEEHVAAIVRMSDTQPGAIWNQSISGPERRKTGPVRLFNAHIETASKSESLR